jgi:hypothetical protein
MNKYLDYVELSFDPEKGIASIRDSLLVILLKWWDTHPLPWSEIDAITQCMMQMMAFKIRSLEVALEGIALYPKGGLQTKYVDFTTVASIVRGIYEMAFIYHNIFVSSDNEDERDILLNIWKIKGYNNRNKIPIPDEMVSLKLKNDETVETIKNRIKAIIHRMDITPSALKNIEKIISKGNNLKGYKFLKVKSKIIEIQQIDFSDANSFMNSGCLDGTYTFLSYQSHPSFLGVEQFGKTDPQQYFEDKFIFMMPACFCASKFTNDACNILSDGNNIKKEKVPDFRATINFFSGF